MSGCNCCFLTGIQVSQEAGKVVWYSHLLKNFPVFHDPYKGFSLVNDTKVDVFCNSLLFLWSNGCWQFDLWIRLPFLNSPYTSGSSQFTYCWSLPKGFWALACQHVKWVQLCGRLNILWITLLWDWSENWPFLFLWPVLSSPNVLAYWVQHFDSIIFQDL